MTDDRCEGAHDDIRHDLPSTRPELDIVATRRTITSEVPVRADASFQFVLITGGQGVLRTSEGERPVRRGCVVVLRTGEWYGYTRCAAMLLVEIRLSSELFTRELAWIGREPELAFLSRPWPRGRHPVIDVAESAAVDRAESWAAELLSPRAEGAAGRALAIGYLTLFLGEIAAAAAAAGATDDRPAFHPSVVRAIQLLEQHIEADWTLTSLAHVVNLAPAYLVRLFGRQVGLPPMAYLNRLRAERVGVLLLDTDLSISAIGESVGWADRTYVSRRFRAVFSVTPAEYRAALRPGAVRPHVKNVQQEVTERLPDI